MLALILSGAVALASLVFFFSAFFAPKLHRKDDFLWSGFGFFYGLMLWNCAQLLTGAVLLGQLVAVILILAFAWQTLRLRAAIAKNAIVEVPSFSLVDWLGGGLKRKPKAPVVVPGKIQEKVTEEKISAEEDSSKVEDQEKPESPVDKVEQTKVAAEEAAEILVETAEEVVEELNTAAETVAEKVVETAEEIVEPTSFPASEQPPAEEKQTKAAEVTLKKPKSKLFQRLFGGKQKPEPVVNVPIPNPEADDEDWGEEGITEQIPPVVQTGLEETSPTETQAVVEEAAAEIVTAVEDAGSEAIQSEDNEVVAVESPPGIESPEQSATETAAETVATGESPSEATIDTSIEEAAEKGRQQEAELAEIDALVEETEAKLKQEKAAAIKESVTESPKSTEGLISPEDNENKVPEAYTAYVEPEEPAEAIADELEPNNNDQDNAPSA